MKHKAWLYRSGEQTVYAETYVDYPPPIWIEHEASYDRRLRFELKSNIPPEGSDIEIRGPFIYRQM